MRNSNREKFIVSEQKHPLNSTLPLNELDFSWFGIGFTSKGRISLGELEETLLFLQKCIHGVAAEPS